MLRTSALLFSVVAIVAAACGSSSSSTGSGGSTASSSSGSPTSTSTSTSGSGGATSSSSGATSSSTSGSGGAGGQAPKSDVHLIGRFDTTDPKNPRFAWPGSAIYAHFNGTGVDVALKDEGQNFFEVVIDGGQPKKLATNGGTTTYNLATGLAAGEHTVLIEKRTESYVGAVTFGGFTPQGGAIVPSVAPFSRGIEFIGDSITCGYGNEGMYPCNFTADTENEYLAFGAVAARTLNAAHAGISYSGIGVYRDYGGNTTDQMPVKYERTFADDPNSAWGFTWTPDAVVIFLGTNDFAKGDPGQPYVDALTKFVKQVRGHYANAFILVATGFALQQDPGKGYIQGVVKALNQAGDAKVSTFDLGTFEMGDPIGCDYHPSTVTDQKMADKVVTAVKAVTGW